MSWGRVSVSRPLSLGLWRVFLGSRFGRAPFQRVDLPPPLGTPFPRLAVVFLFGAPSPCQRASATVRAPPSGTLRHLFLFLKNFLLFSFCVSGAVCLCCLRLGVPLRSRPRSPDPVPARPHLLMPSCAPRKRCPWCAAGAPGASLGACVRVGCRGLCRRGFFLILLDHVIFA